MIEATQTTTIVSRNPANGEILGEIRVTDVAEISVIVGKARGAFEAWKATSLEHRLAAVERFRKLLYETREELSKLISSEVGKPKVESLVAEIFGVLETCVWLQQNARRVLHPQKVQLNQIFFTGKQCYNVFEPLGVVAVISPWNYPFSIPVATILAALVAGNAVVFKPSPKTALIAQAAVDLIRRAGFPDDIVGLVQGDKEQAEGLIASDVKRVMFTGSVGGGRAIMGLAAKKLLPVTLELGGKHAAIVLKDSNVEEVAPCLVWAAFTNAGQACASIERIYVEKPIAEALTKRIGELTAQLRLGDPLKDDTDIGPLIDESQIHRVQKQVDDAVAAGAVVVSGGRSRLDLGGNFFEPTVLTNVTNSMDVIKEEIFGPVVPIVAVADADDAVAHANASPLGLGSSIWTNNLQYAEQLARRIEAGMVWVNDSLYTHICPDAPWGGMKDSGFGRMHSAVELLDLVYIKNIGLSKQGARDWNYPYGQQQLDSVRGGMELIHGGTIADKLKALLTLISFKLKPKR